MTATALWAAVVDGYEANGLIQLTNPRDRSAVAIDTTYGEKIAQSVIDIFKAYTQVDYDSSDALHVEVGMAACIALLWRRGGTSTNIEKVKWEEVFGGEGMANVLKKTDPRGHEGPSTNSGLTQPAENCEGGTYLPWSHPRALPGGYSYLPQRIRYDGC